MNIEKAKQIPIEMVLQKMNYTPSKTNGFDVWYLSPLHDEKTPSFKANTKINRWYDHGLQKGGNVIILRKLFRCIYFFFSKAKKY
jgi:DNA primase